MVPIVTLNQRFCLVGHEMAGRREAPRRGRVPAAGTRQGGPGGGARTRAGARPGSPAGQAQFPDLASRAAGQMA
ncbi:MAG TPA: hypothetical protein VH637_26040 [Streptosporangiaceae bacterium]